MAIINRGGVISQHFRDAVITRYKGKVHRLVVNDDPALVDHVRVFIEFHLPIYENGETLDELKVFRRINKVIEVIAEGDDEPK